MTDHIKGKTIVITGAGGGFGKLVSQKAGARGANMVCADINEAALGETVESVNSAGGNALAITTDVSQLDQMKALAAAATEKYGAIDVMVNNAGIMPLAFYADHEDAAGAWERCIDINIKGTLNGIIAVYDQMISQGRGHVINLSSIYGNFPVVGAGVYGASKAAVNFMSESLRVESRGKIKVTIIKPTGVPGTGLGGGVINPDAVAGILGQNILTYGAEFTALGEGTLEAEKLDAENVQYAFLDPGFIADQIVMAIDQPWGVSLGDITVRASGDGFIL